SEACRLDGANADCRLATLDCAQAASAAAPSVRPSKRTTFGRPETTTLRNASTDTPAMPARLMEGISNLDRPAPRQPVSESWQNRDLTADATFWPRDCKPSVADWSQRFDSLPAQAKSLLQHGTAQISSKGAAFGLELPLLTSEQDVL